MGSEDRDRRFEQALSRHLRTARSGDAASAGSDALSQAPVCLDPEMLAAYHERSLLPEEMNSAKEHIVGCARCQSVLAQLEITDSIPLLAGEKKEEQVLVTAPEKAHAAIPVRGPRWPWFIPAGALAAGLLVWIGFHEQHPASLLHPTEETKIAKAQTSSEAAASSSAPLATRQAPASPPAGEYDALLKSPSGAGGARNGERLSARENLEQQKQVPSAQGAPGRPAADKESALLKDARGDSSRAPWPAESRADLDTKSAAGVVAGEKAELQSPMANNQAQNQAQYQMVPPSIRRSTESATAAKKSKSQANADLFRAAVPPTPASADEVSEFTSSNVVEVPAVSNPHLIAVTGSSSLWRAGRAGMIDFSTDRGVSWSRQISGVLTDLAAGSAPSEKVCWIVGRAGTIVLTTDGGAHWSILRSPVGDDLGGVRASDALHASIWNLRNTKSFETVDGGITWKSVPAP